MVEKINAGKGKTRRRIVDINPASRPSRARGTESVSGPCSLCGSVDWETDDTRGETTCGTCGFVAAQNMIDPGAEWTNHSDGDDRSRVGAPTRIDLSDKGLNTSIDRRDISAGKHGMSARQARDWRRRQVIDQRSKTRDSRSRNLSQAMQFIKNHGGLPPQIQQQAAGLYRKAVESGLVTGRSIRGVSAACVYVAAREARIPRRIEDVAEAFDMASEVEKKELKRTIRLVARTLGAHHVTGPEEYLEKFHSDLGLPAPILGDVRALWNRVQDQYAWQGKKPSGIAGVLLYHASQKSGSPRTQSEVCRVSGISEVTLRGLLKQLNSMLESK